MRIALIRQRPSIGDVLLLGPLIREIKRTYPGSHLTVITDPTYISGALVTAFEGIPGIDRIDQILARDWTTESNKLIDPSLRFADTEPPYTVSRADKVFDCNAAFMQFERDFNGKTPYGISEFWL